MTHTISIQDVTNEKEILQWIMVNCESFSHLLTTNTVIDNNFIEMNDFVFHSEKDAVWFRLYWS